MEEDDEESEEEDEGVFELTPEGKGGKGMVKVSRALSVNPPRFRVTTA